MLLTSLEGSGTHVKENVMMRYPAKVQHILVAFILMALSVGRNRSGGSEVILRRDDMYNIEIGNITATRMLESYLDINNDGNWTRLPILWIVEVGMHVLLMQNSIVHIAESLKTIQLLIQGQSLYLEQTI